MLFSDFYTEIETVKSDFALQVVKNNYHHELQSISLSKLGDHYCNILICIPKHT